MSLLKLIALYFLLLFSIPLCAQENKPHLNFEQRKQELINTDTQFSKLSEEKGLNEAFLLYIADDGVLLRQNSFPVKGKELIKEKFFSDPDSEYTLTWTPMFADIAESGELGYTYGIYEFRTIDPVGNPFIGKGTYVSIWKKDQFGNWKFVLDTGNEGLEPK